MFHKRLPSRKLSAATLAAFIERCNGSLPGIAKQVFRAKYELHLIELLWKLNEIQFCDEYNVLFYFKDSGPNTLFQIKTNYGNVKLFLLLDNCNISRFVLEATLSYIT